ncbi:SAG family member [Eimeria brunetti]|uniref:SAG family member n=1 Tax=Eimeria brunetti TaxID=51314 RepID=U6LQ33_9EIME|nr:SAG family member [Eimeria brunetti]
MAALKFLSLATAAVFLLDTKGGNASSSTTTTNEVVRVDCSEAMNVARSRVGFTDLAVGKDTGEVLPIEPTGSLQVTGSNYVDEVCKALKAEGSGTPTSKSTTLNGTYAHAVQEGANADCKAAVDYWKAALKNFTGLPPTYTSETDLYKNSQNVSFISLFNPKENPKVDCAYFTCPAKQTDNNPPVEGDGEEEEGEEGEPGGGSKQPGDNVKNSMGRNIESGDVSATDKEVKALVCITTPNALTKDTAPYTQSQWDQITTGLNGSAAAVPTFLGLLAAAVGSFLL